MGLTLTKKVALLNFYFANKNYGAVLQAAALQDFLRKKGYSPFNIKLLFIDKRSKLRKVLSGVLLHIKQLVNPKKFYTVGNQKAFADFRDEWIVDTDQSYSYTNIGQFAEQNKDVLAYIVGSDQVWRPSYTVECTESYFLEFVGDEKKKIAYAASFGKDYWELEAGDSLTLQLKDLIGRFSAVSVREDSGKEISKQVFDCKADHVLDPTLLVGRGFFEEIIETADIGIQEGNVVYYKLDPDEDFMKGITFLKDEYSCEAENIYFNENIVNGRIHREYNSVPLWLAKLRDAKLIVTDSYHCVCFALLFNKPFIAYSNQSRGKARFESLFSLLDLDEKSLYLSSSSQVVAGNYSLIEDFSEVNQKLMSLRKSSANFLLSNLSND